ncbi:MAG: LVIVD repeat-containing protein [Thermoplasmatota archaeon]
MRTLVALLSTLALLGGCLDSGNGPDDADAAANCPAGPFDQPGLDIVPTTVDPIVDDKDRALEFETTNVRTCSLPAIGWSALDPDGTPHKYLGELDMRGDLGLGAVAVVGSGEPGRVYVVDIADRENPAVLSFIDLPGAHVTDVKISEDGQVLYVASQALPTLELATGTAPDLAASSGFTAYSLADPTAPAYLGTVPDEGLGCHMLDPVQVSATQDAVMCISSNLKSYLVQRDGARLVPLGFVEYFPSVDGVPTPSGVSAAGDPTCLTVPVVNAGPGLCALSSGPHDMTAFHENGAFGDGKSYLVVSHWGEGVKVLDITDAPQITEVGAWNGEGAEHYSGNVHTAMMFEAGGKRYIMASPEYTGAGTVPGLWVLDATDLGHLQLVSQWYHPGLHESQGLFLTTHQWQVAPTGADVAAEDVRIYLTMNHAGMWVLDFGAILAGDDQGAILGFNLARTPIPEDHVGNAILSTWDVNVVDGYIYGTDRATGLWVFHYSGDELGNVALTGFA